MILDRDTSDLYDDEFITYLQTFIEEEEKEHMGGEEVGDEVIIITDLSIFKTMKMIEFFEKNNFLKSYEFVTNIVDFINSDNKYSEIYSDDRNKVILDKYINATVTVDDILDRILKNGLPSLLQVELEKLRSIGF
jgi:hypothetical protein